MNNPVTLIQLSDFLAQATHLPFAMWGWNKAPAGSYGVVSADDDATFFAEGNAERIQRGYVDWFARSEGFADKAAIESALQGSGWHWRLNSVQYEDQGLVHYEWRVAWLG